MSLHEMFEKLDDACVPNGGSQFQWTAKGVGFGEFYFYEEDGKIKCSNELMGKEFIKRMLCKMVDECELTCVSEKNKDSQSD